MSFEHCQSCLPPTRYPGCHSDCPYYQADIAKYNEAKEEEARQTQERGAYWGARQFKTRRYQRTKRGSEKMKYRQLYVALDHKHAGVVTCVADSPTELAKKCGVAQSTIIRWTFGDCECTVKFLLKLEEITGRPFRELFGECEGRG